MDASAILIQINNKVPSDSLIMLKERLESNPDKANNISVVPLKSPIIGLILGWFFGFLGVDRFYKGDLILGVIKLLIFIISWPATFILIGYFMFFCLWIWVIVDLFLVWKGIKRDNLNKILNALSN